MVTWLTASGCIREKQLPTSKPICWCCRECAIFGLGVTILLARNSTSARLRLGSRSGSSRLWLLRGLIFKATVQYGTFIADRVYCIPLSPTMHAEKKRQICTPVACKVHVFKKTSLYSGAAPS